MSSAGSGGGVANFGANKFVSEVKRSHHAGALRAHHAGQSVVIMGWIDGRRDHGGLIFVDVRATLPSVSQ